MFHKESGIDHWSWYLAILTLLLCLITSCKNKELDYPGVEAIVTVRFDWPQPGMEDVDGMTVYFFPDETASRLWRFDIAGAQGGKIELPTGSYQMLAVNNDLSGVRFSEATTFSRFYAYARSYSGDTLTTPTGMLYSATVTHVRIHNSSVSYLTDAGDEVISREGVIQAPVNLQAVTYHIMVDSVNGVERVRTAKAVLRGVARGVNVATGDYTPNSCAMITPMDVVTQPHGSFTAVASAFGSPPVDEPAFSLEIIVSTPRAVYSKTFDVTRQVLNNNGKRDVYIYISGVDVPDSDVPSGEDVGIEVGVEGWQIIEITYS